MLHIAGGVYRELCEVPAWDADFGSGGRAAAAVSALSPGSVLHTYAPTPEPRGIETLKRLGVDVYAHPSAHPIVFSYFHPLSRPYIAPRPQDMVVSPPFTVRGEAVLRFGFLEGDAIVEGRRVVYDPQTPHPTPFAANGSHAAELAVVLNEGEARLMGRSDDLDAAARDIVATQNAAVIIVKRGPRGAAVYQRGGTFAVPAYRSDRVFKIGSGDVFSAVFAFYWAEMHVPAADAADRASRAVAAYCTTRKLPADEDTARKAFPVPLASPGCVLLAGSVATLGQRWTMEEARFALAELGAPVAAPALDGGNTDLRKVAAVLVLADGILASSLEVIAEARSRNLAVVVLAEMPFDHKLEGMLGANVLRTDDFVSALYFAVWATMPGAGRRSATVNRDG